MCFHKRYLKIRLPFKNFRLGEWGHRLKKKYSVVGEWGWAPHFEYNCPLFPPMISFHSRFHFDKLDTNLVLYMWSFQMNTLHKQINGSYFLTCILKYKIKNEIQLFWKLGFKTWNFCQTPYTNFQAFEARQRSKEQKHPSPFKPYPASIPVPISIVLKSRYSILDWCKVEFKFNIPRFGGPIEV